MSIRRGPFRNIRVLIFSGAAHDAFSWDVEALRGVGGQWAERDDKLKPVIICSAA
jgi:hypothetical protein